MRKGQSRSRTGISIAIAGIAVAICLSAAGVARAADYTIAATAADTVWHPGTLTVQTNDTVTWTFESGGYHNVKSTSANWTFTSGSPPSSDRHAVHLHRAGQLHVRLRCAREP